MSEDTILDGVPLIGVWAWWHIRERKPGVSAVPPPMPPLEEWPKEILETFERIRRRRLLREEAGLSGHGGPTESDEPE